jgi:hypothetical protein
MATQNPLFPTGQWVQLASVQDAGMNRKTVPTWQEQTVGIVRGSFSGPDGPYYQVVWSPGNNHPQTGLYKAVQLCAIDPKTAAGIASQMASGNYTINTGKRSQPQQETV